MSLFYASAQPQPVLTAAFASFASQHRHSYTLSRELANPASQNDFHLTDGGVE
jgi:hypothetical protein